VLSNERLNYYYLLIYDVVVAAGAGAAGLIDYD
jgi:hypothetical protein